MTAQRTILQAVPLIKRSEHRIQDTPSSKKALATFARCVRSRRIEMGHTLISLKNEIGISKSQMSHIECGDNWPAMAVYVRLCEVLKVGTPPLLGPKKKKGAVAP